jgi:hypothetical protein
MNEFMSGTGITLARATGIDLGYDGQKVGFNLFGARNDLEIDCSGTPTFYKFGSKCTIKLKDSGKMLQADFGNWDGKSNNVAIKADCDVNNPGDNCYFDFWKQ